MERKECNAEGKTSACQKTSFISAINFYPKSSLVSSFSVEENELTKLDFG
jgi:hypothetical protein